MALKKNEYYPTKEFSLYRKNKMLKKKKKRKEKLPNKHSGMQRYHSNVEIKEWGSDLKIIVDTTWSLIYHFRKGKG